MRRVNKINVGTYLYNQICIIGSVQSDLYNPSRIFSRMREGYELALGFVVYYDIDTYAKRK